jgi:superfamily I DNA and/or RNA helicase
MVSSPQALSAGFGATLFERVVDRFGARCVKLLDVQYRMNAAIAEWSSSVMYGGTS